MLLSQMQARDDNVCPNSEEINTKAVQWVHDSCGWQRTWLKILQNHKNVCFHTKPLLLETVHVDMRGGMKVQFCF